MNIVWKSYSNPSPYRDAAYSSCILGNIVFSTGFDEAMGYGRQRFRVESRSIRDGYVHGTWVDNDSHSFSSLYSCLVSKDMVYVVGATERFWNIIVLIGISMLLIGGILINHCLSHSLWLEIGRTYI